MTPRARNHWRTTASVVVASLAASVAGGCLNWQAGYDYAARRECQANPDDVDRRACLNQVEQVARERKTASDGSR